MSKFVGRAAEVIGVVVAIAAAIPTGGGSTLLAGILGSSVATASAVAVGAELALAGISALTAKSPSSLANPMEWQSNPQAGIPHIMGRSYKSGAIVLKEGTTNDRDQSTGSTRESPAADRRRLLRRGWDDP